MKSLLYSLLAKGSPIGPFPSAGFIDHTSEQLFRQHLYSIAASAAALRRSKSFSPPFAASIIAEAIIPYEAAEVHLVS
jgi:hypothetical protein